MQEIIEYLKSIRPLSPGLEDHLRLIIRPYYFKKDDLLLRSGEVADQILFIKSGLIRSFTVVKGERRSGWFMKEGNIIIAVISFLRQVASRESMEALEDCECWGTTYSELLDAFDRFPEFLWHGFIILGEYYGRMYERLTYKLELKGKEYYAVLMKEDPELVQRISNEHMASFLGVSVRSVANYRKAYSQRRGRGHNGKG